MRARLTNPHVFIQLMSFRQYLGEEHFHFRIDFTCSDQHLNTPVVSAVPVDLLPRGMSGRKPNPSSQVLLARFQFEALCEVLSAILSSPSISEEQRGRLQALLFRIIRLIRAFPG